MNTTIMLKIIIKNNTILMKSLVITVFLTIHTIGLTQNADSLQKKLTPYRENSIATVDSLNSIAIKTFNTYPDSTLRVISEARLMARKINYTDGEANSFYIEGITKIDAGNYDSSIINLNKANELFASTSNKKGQSKCLNAIGISFTNQEKYTLAIDALKKALEINKQINDTGNIGTSFFNIANIQYKKTAYDSALVNYEKALEIKKKLNDIRGESLCINNIGVLYKDIGDYPNALKYFNKSLLIEESNNNEIAVANRLTNIGVIYKKREQLDKSLEYLKKAILIYEKYDKTYNLAISYSNLGNIYNSQENIVDAEKMYKKSLELSKSIDFHSQISTTLNNLGSLFTKKGNFKLAQDYLNDALDINLKYDNRKGICLNYVGLTESYHFLNMNNKSLDNSIKAEKIATELGLIDIQNKIYQLQSEIFYNKKQYKNAYHKLLLHKNLNDSIYSKEKIQEITEIEYEYKYKKVIDSANTREIGLNKKVNIAYKSIEESEKQKLSFIIFGLGIMFLLGIVILVLKLKNINSLKHNILVEQKLLRSQMTPHFIFNSLTVLQGIILNKEYKKSIKYLSRFSKLLRITLENSRDKMVTLDKEIEAVENYLILQNLRTENPYIYTINIDENINKPQLLIPPMMIQPFVENAIEHAFRQKEEKDQNIDIIITFVQKELICTIIDNGIGIHSYEKKQAVKKSLATTITRERLKVFAKEFNVKANLKIEDRKGFDEKGTIITLTLPYKAI